MGDQLYEELLVELECPICTNYMSPPIRQCATGHPLCEACLKKLPRCALCQSKFTESRNLPLEGLAVKMRYPCINKGSGCQAKLTYTERDLHELRCPHKGFRCAMERCPWVGRLEDLAAHWASKKMSSKPYHKKNLCHTKIKTESYYVNMMEAYNKLFWFKCKLTKNTLFWAVQYIGVAAEAEKYYYEIEIFKPGRMRKKILVSDYCQSIELENSQLFNEGCAFVSTDVIAGFVGPDQLLVYYMRVLEVKDDVLQMQDQATAHRVDKSYKQRDRSKGPAAHLKDYKKKQYSQKAPQKQREDFVLL